MLKEKEFEMIIEIHIPDTLPEGRRSSFKKGIVDALIESATTKSSLEHTPEGHEAHRDLGKTVGKELATKIQGLYLK